MTSQVNGCSNNKLKGLHEWVQEANWNEEKIQYRCMWCNQVECSS